MIKSTSILLLTLLTTTTLAFAAETPTPAAPSRRPGPVRSPEVQPDYRVTFRLRAPKATEVLVTGQWPNGRASMVKDADGLFSVTVGPIEPGVWEYSFQVDGISMIDPSNPAIKPMREPRTSILHLPGQPLQLHDFQNVPHGVVRQHTYASKALGRLRELAVYTPPGYDQQSAAKFPTLYLQHGSGDNQATWTAHGKAQWILDNLIAQGQAKPMVVVMMDGHAAIPGTPQNNTELFERDLFEDVMPFVEANYRVKTDAANRAIVGLSMGGGQSLTIGLNHLDRFSWVGGFSSAVPSREAIASALRDSAATNHSLKLLWIACGKNDFLLKRNEEFISLLKEQNIQHEWHLTDGDHSWPIWRRYLGQFLPKLF
ncbi:MAG TPA: alpha/beta hydrolase-fold protein [Tepidisphaeraceae bacterium]|nr:alpha/beta hydrolase-fold protein [Tepidisphaeraceae bacterium]